MKIQDYLQIWSGAATDVMQQALGTAFKIEIDPGDEHGPETPPAGSGLWLEFKTGEPLSLQQAFWISPSDAVYFGQSFMAEDPNPLAELTDDHRDAVGELFRQIAGSVALVLKATVGRECPVQFIGSAAPGWAAVSRARFRLVAEGRPPLAVHLQLDSRMETEEKQAVKAASPGASASPAAAAARPMIPPPVSTPLAPPAAVLAPAADEQSNNLELLLDMELEVAIRFGKREMQLRDIIELNAGSVIEFEQHIQDPVELLLGDRIIGHGEVVVVDGNYGLRMTEIVGAQSRLNSLVK